MILDTLNQARARWVDELRELAVTGDMPFKEYIIPNADMKRWQETHSNFTLFFTYKFGGKVVHVVSSSFIDSIRRYPWSMYVYHNYKILNEMKETYLNLTDEQLVIRLAALANDSPLPETTNHLTNWSNHDL
jgi:hypothetical protein